MKKPSQKVAAYSPDTDTHYPSWAELLAAETNGWAVITIITNVSRRGKVRTWPYVVGAFDDERSARLAARRLRRKWKAEDQLHPHQTYSFHVRPLWQPDRTKEDS